MAQGAAPNSPDAEQPAGVLSPSKSSSPGKENIARSALIAGVVSLLLSPVSILVGYWLTHSLASPKLKPEYCTVVVVVKNAEPDWAALDKLRTHQAQAAPIRDLLMRFGLTKSKAPCVSWLDSNKWLDDCVDDIQGAVHWQLAVLASQGHDLDTGLKSLDTGSFVGVSSPDMSAYIAAVALKDKASARHVLTSKLAAVEADATLLNEILGTVAKTDEQPRPRTGDVILRVGVLNAGDSDGVTTRRAVLRFGESEVQMRAQKYTVIKAHSLEEVDFEVDAPSTTSSHLDRLRSLVRAHLQDPFMLEINAGDSGTLTVSGRFPE